MVILYFLGGIVLLFLIYVLFLWICTLPVKMDREYDTDSGFYRWLLYSNTALWVRLLRIRIHVTGREKIPAGEKVVFVGNHISNYDPILTWHVFRQFRIAFISKPENFKIPFFGPYIHRCRFLKIDRQDPRKAIVTIRKAADMLSHEGYAIGVYPEGTRSKDGKLLPFHNGVFKIAQRGGASVAVLAIAGTEQIHRNTPLRATDVYLDVRAVIPAETVQSMKTEEIGSAVRALLEAK